MWKIEFGVFPKNRHCRLVVGACSFFLRRECSDVPMMATYRDLCCPFAIGLLCPHSFVSRDSVNWLSSIPGVLLIGGYAQIGLTIVETIAVDMVAVFPWLRIKDRPVHSHMSVAPSAHLAANYVPCAGLTAVSAPFVFSQSLVVVVINNGDFALSQWYLPQAYPSVLSAIRRQA
jgi:hypothetical protein